MWRRSLTIASVLALFVVAAMPVQAGWVPDPPVFTAEDIGGPGVAGSTVGTFPGPITVTGGGGDIWGNSDQFHYYHAPWDGDFIATARLVSQQNTDGWAKGGIMLRETNAAGSIHTHVSATPGNLVGLQWRDSTAGGSGSMQFGGSPNTTTDGSAPVWMRLERAGDTLTGSWAPDASGAPGAWTTGGSHTIGAMPSTAELGLSVTSHNNGTSSAVVFDNIQVVAPSTIVAEIGIVAPDNPRVIGRAYALDPDTAEVLGPVHWKIERLVGLTQPGLMNEWYYNETFTPPTIVPPFRTDSVDRGDSVYPDELGWGAGNRDNFSVRYTARFYADHDGTYAFQEHVDDECWLVIDGNEELHDTDWGNYSDTSVALTMGWHDLEFRTREGGGGDFAHLSWDPAGGTDWQIMHTDDAMFESGVLVPQLLAEGFWNVGDPMDPDFFGLFLSQPEEYRLRLTVDFVGRTAIAEGTFMGVPEPATCLLLGGGLLALIRRRRRA